MRRGVRWHATAKTFFGGTGAKAAQRPQGGRTWILPREPLDHEGHRRRRDGGRDGGHGHKGRTFARLGPRRREGRAVPRRNRKPGAKGADPEAGELNIEGRAAPGGLHAPGDAAGILARSGCRRGKAP